MPTVQDLEEEYIHRKILQHRKRGRRIEYLVRWEGYGSEYDSWEAHVDLTKEVIEDYRRALEASATHQDDEV